MDRATLEWIGTMVAEDVVHNLRMAHMQVWKLYTAVHDLQAAAVREEAQQQDSRLSNPGQRPWEVETPLTKDLARFLEQRQRFSGIDGG